MHKLFQTKWSAREKEIIREEEVPRYSVSQAGVSDDDAEEYINIYRREVKVAYFNPNKYPIRFSKIPN